MKKYCLAIPAVSVLAFATLLPAYPQSNPDTPQTPSATSAAAESSSSMSGLANTSSIAASFQGGRYHDPTALPRAWR